MLEVQPLWRTETGVVHRGLCPSGWLRSTVASFSQGVHKMHANLLAWNSILHIILVYKVVIMFKSNGPCVFHWIPNLTAPQNYLHRF